VAIEAESLFGVAARAKARARLRFFGVALPKAGAVEPREPRLVDLEAPRQRRRGDTMAARTEGLGMTRGAKIPARRGPNAVLADEVALVHHVARGLAELPRQVHVAGLAISGVPLVFVRVTTKALRHGRTHRGLICGARRCVTRHTLVAEAPKVSVVSEPQVLARQPVALAGVGLAMAIGTGALIVGLCVTRHAGALCRQMQLASLTSLSDARVTLCARDPLDGVGPVLEGMLCGLWANAKNASASGQHERHDEEERAPHRGRPSNW
jgi:hypothetical protein